MRNIRNGFIISILSLLIIVFSASCSRNGSGVHIENTDADNTSISFVDNEGGTDGGANSIIREYAQGEDDCSLYLGTKYTLMESDEFVVGGQSYMYGDLFAFLAYRRDGDKYANLIGQIDYSDIAALEVDGELGAVKDAGEVPQELIKYIKIDFSDDYAIKNFCVDEKNIYALGFTKGDNGFEYSLWIFDSDGSLVKKMDIQDDDSVYGDCDKVVHFSENGTDYIAVFSFDKDKSCVTVLNIDGEIVAKDEYPYYIQNVFCAEDGSLMFVSNYGDDGKYDKCISAYNVGDGLKTSAYITGIKPYISVTDRGDTLYIQNKDGVYIADGASNQYSMIMKWSDMGIDNFGTTRQMDGNTIVSAGVKLDDKDIGIVLLRFEKSDAMYSGDRKEVVIGVSVEPDSYLQYMVKLFNDSQGLYEAVVKSYPYSSDRTQKLGTEMITGTGPDLIQQTLFDIEEYTSVGMVEDLRDYLSKSETLSEDMLVKSVIDVCTANGKLAVIPATFGISTLSGKAKYIGADTVWTFDEFMECVKNNAGCAVGGIGTAYDTGRYLVMLAYMSDSGKYVDWKNFEAHFDSPEFVELLSYAAEYKVDDGYDISSTEKLTEAFADGQNIIYDGVINCMAAYQTIRDTLGDDAVFKGYPGDGDEPVYHAVINNGYAINSMSDNKDGAWKFIEFLITQGYSDGIKYDSEAGSGTGFSIMNDKLDAIFDGAKQINPVYDENGEPKLDAQGNIEQSKKGTMNGYDYYAATDEDVSGVRYLIEHIGSVVTENEIIYNIICEELDSLFAGQSTPQKTAQLIQNRVQLYLDERN